MDVKIPCGGFKIDEDSFSLGKDGVTLSLSPLTIEKLPMNDIVNAVIDALPKWTGGSY